jgi:hypothetical protein
VLCNINWPQYKKNPADVHSLVFELDMTVLPIKHRIQPLRQCIGQFQDTNWMLIIQGRQALQGNSILPVMTIITTIDGTRRSPVTFQPTHGFAISIWVASV